MVNPGGVGGGGHIHRQQYGQEGVRTKDAQQPKETKDAKGTKGAEGKGEAKGAQAGGVKAKAKAKGKDMGGVEGLVAGSDQYAVEDEDQNRRRRSRSFFAEDEPQLEQKDPDDEAGTLSSVGAEFRDQVTAGLAAGRSFTRGTLNQNRSEEEQAALAKKAALKKKQAAKSAQHG